MPEKARAKQGRDHRGRWLPGRSGNRSGRPRGRGKDTIAAMLDKANAPKPLDVLLALMSDPRASQRTRLAAATAAAPYVHPRLSAADVTMRKADISKLSDAELETLTAIAARLEADHDDQS